MMRSRCMPMGLVLGVLILASAVLPAQAADTGWVPQWKVGDEWVVRAWYRDLRYQGDVWLPPVDWHFKVQALKSIHRQECYVVYVYPERRSLKVQAILYLSTRDLHPIKVVDIYSTPGGVKSSERECDPFHAEPLLSESSMIPYDLPVFPLERPATVQNADGFAAYRDEAPKTFAPVRKVGNLKFKKKIAQKTNQPSTQRADSFGAYRNTGTSFEVQLSDSGVKGTMTQMWQEGQPWAVGLESKAVRCRLLPSKSTPTSGDLNSPTTGNSAAPAQGGQ